jgi:hypothetical protein
MTLGKFVQTRPIGKGEKHRWPMGLHCPPPNALTEIFYTKRRKIRRK